MSMGRCGRSPGRQPESELGPLDIDVAAGFRLSAVLVMAGSLLALDAAPLAGFWVPGLSWLGYLGAAALGSGMAMGVRLARRSRRPLLPALAFPVCMVGIFVCSGVLVAPRGEANVIQRQETGELRLGVRDGRWIWIGLVTRCIPGINPLHALRSVDSAGTCIEF